MSESASHRLQELNGLSAQEAFEAFLACCGSRTWAKAMTGHRPFPNRETLFQSVDQEFSKLKDSDWLEAFSAHPKIGDLKSIASGKGHEQAQVAKATGSTLSELGRLNADYFEKFGFIFIICASGKDPQFMLEALRQRVRGTRESELKNAAREQAEITKLRLEKRL